MQTVRYQGHWFTITESESRSMKNAASRAYHSAMKAEFALSCDKVKATTSAQSAHRKVVDEYKQKYLNRHKALETLTADGDDDAADIN